MKTLIIAEKPSVARDIASALGKIKKEGEWYENDEYIISSAVGHLVELFMPEDIDKKYAYWRMNTLPIIPQKFQLKPIEKSKAKFQELKKLMNRKDVDTVVNACDAGREGELIFTYIYELGKCKKEAKRLWLQSMTPKAIKNAFENLRPIDTMEPLKNAARCRSEADWLIGINGTRAFTKRMYGSRGGNVASVGRVQTPTLSLVYHRELEIRRFKPTPYWQVKGTFKIDRGEYEGTYQRPSYSKDPNNEHDRAFRIWDEDQARAIYGDIENQTAAEIIDKKKRTKQSPQLLYDLTTLQREANNRHGLPAGKTLRIAQALYEKHKMITYPRTDSHALPEDYIPTAQRILGSLPDQYTGHADKVLSSSWVKPNKRIFNNAQISDHFAIIPTGESKKINEEESKIYDMITRRFISAFYPPAEYDVTTRNTKIGEHNFKTEGKVLVVPGWLAVYGKTENSGAEGELPATTPNDGDPPKASVLSVELDESETLPPNRYSEATLLRAMETAGKLLEDDELALAMKEKGLGTPATRAQIIDHLIALKYMERDGRELIPTVKAENLIEFLNVVHVEELINPSMTGEWEHKLHQIEDGLLSREEFMKGIADISTKVVERAKNFEEKDEDFEKTNIISPTDGLPLIKNFRTYKSQDGEIVIYNSMGNRKLSAEEIEILINKREIGPLDGFRSKHGKPYSAKLKLNEENKVRFVFENAETEGQNGEPVDFSSMPIVGVCPIDGTNVRETPTTYASEATLDKSGKGNFRIQRTLLNKSIPPEQIKKLLEEKKTDLIEGFVSNRTKKKFSAYLVIKEDDNKGWSFEFPARTAKKASKKKTKKLAQKKNAEPAKASAGNKKS